MLPSAALMPPCAATVCERVGKSFVTQLETQTLSKVQSAAPLSNVRSLKASFGEADGRAQTSAAGADDHRVILVVYDLPGGRSARVAAALLLREPPRCGEQLAPHKALSTGGRVRNVGRKTGQRARGRNDRTKLKQKKGCCNKISKGDQLES
jgi:hypothetical protein